MGAFTDNLENKLLDYTLNTTASTNYTKPTALWVGLCTASPTETVTNECTVSPYARKQIAFGVASGGTCTGPTATTQFLQATGSAWGTIYGYAIFDASSGSTGASNYLYYGSLASNVTVNTNDTVEFATNAISISYD